MSDHSELLASLSRLVLEGDDGGARTLAADALQRKIPALLVVDEGLVPGIRRAGELWEEGEYFLPELVSAAQAMKAAMVVLAPALAEVSAATSRGRVVIGTVHGDIHDIGKTLVGTLLSANGFAVTDEGADVPVERFVARAQEIDADLVCASALLTTTMGQQRSLVEAVRAAGLRARVLVGGAPVNASWASTIGADGYAENAVAAVAVAEALVVRRDR